MSKLALAFFALTASVWFGCRADLPDDDARLTADASQKIWINSYGEEGECEPPAASCAEFDNDQKFVDLCVAEGFQARTCGCSVKCSGAVSYKKDRPAATAGSSTSGADAGCSPDDLGYFQQVKATLGKATDLGECITGHVCKGHTVKCTSTDLEVSRNIRSKARRACGTEATSMFCQLEKEDTFACAEPTVDTLSREWRAAFKEDDRDLRQCLLNTICTGKIDRCSGSLRSRAEAVRAGLEQQGCGYWRGYFCQLGADRDI